MDAPSFLHRRALLLATLAVAASCAARPPPAPLLRPSLDQVLGVVAAQGDTLLFLTANQHLAPGTSVAMVDPAERVAFTVAAGPLGGDPPDAFPLVLIDEVPAAAYSLHSARSAGSLELPELGVASRPGAVPVDPARPDLDGDGQPETVSECTSLEGMHILVSTGDSEPRWHAYYALGYDVEPTCPD